MSGLIIHHRRCVVSSDHPEANEEMAKIFADVLSDNWLEGHPYSEPIYVTAQLDNGEDVIFKVELAQ